ncbi:MAG: sensor histidine kinase [Bacteroidales bacterium]
MIEIINCKKEKYYNILLIVSGIFFLGVIIPIVVGIITNTSFHMILENVFFSTISTTALWLGCQYIISILWKVFPWEKHPAKHIIWEIISIALYNLLVVGFVFIIGALVLKSASYGKYFFMDIYTSCVIISLVISFIHEGVFLYIMWMKSDKRSQELEKESLLSQFETLKNQVNPHFLFNSFNTLITLIEEDKDIAVEYVQKLSDFFRIILQLRDKSMISIQEELELIKTYGFLQMKRYGNNLVLKNSIPSNVLSKGIAPLTLQMLLENAIKHNVIATGRPLNIEISLTGNDYIMVKNNIQKRTEEEPSAGLGLQNIRNRYKFLSDKDVEIIVSSQYFSVAIPLLDEIENK